MARGRRSATDAGGAESSGDDVERLRSSFDPANWNAAVSLQCAVRDYIERPVTMEQACQMVAKSIRDRDFEPFIAKAWQTVFDVDKAAREREREAREAHERANAGKRDENRVAGSTAQKDRWSDRV